MIRITEAMARLKEAGWEKIENWNRVLDDESIRRYIAQIQKEDGVSYEEAWRLVREDPKYSLGYKMCSPAIVMMLRMRGGKARFREMLTPEELRIFDEEVDGKINLKKAIKYEYKKQKKARRKAKA